MGKKRVFLIRKLFISILITMIKLYIACFLFKNIGRHKREREHQSWIKDSTFNRACIISGTWLRNSKRWLSNALNFLQSRAWHNPCRWTASQNNHRLEHVRSEHFTSRCDHLTQFRKKPLDDFCLTLMTLVYIKGEKEEKEKGTRMFDRGKKITLTRKDKV